MHKYLIEQRNHIVLVHKYEILNRQNISLIIAVKIVHVSEWKQNFTTKDQEEFSSV